MHRVMIPCGSQVMARHERSYERETAVYCSLHYLALLERKSRALDQVAPSTGLQLPECFPQLRRLLEAQLHKHGSHEYIQVLRLLETFARGEVTSAIENALRLGTISFDAVRHLVLCRIERRPQRLDLARCEFLSRKENVLLPSNRTSSTQCRASASSPSGPAFEVRGRTVSPNAGLATTAAICSTM